MSAASRHFRMDPAEADVEDRSTFLARDANIRLHSDSWECIAAGETLTKSIVLHSFPSESLKR